MKELLEKILNGALPEGVEYSVVEETDENGDLVLSITLPDEYKGKIIGREGKNINAIRQVVSLLARRKDMRVYIKIAE